MSDYPCKSCTRAKDPNKCENKKCPDWKDWFLSRWYEMRNCIQHQCNATLQCKECEFFAKWVDRYICQKHNIFVDPNDFCSRGERKNNDNQQKT